MTNLHPAPTTTPGTSHTVVRNAGAGLALVAALFLGACSTEALLEETIERTTDLEDVDLGEDGGGFTITDENGETVTFDFDETGAGSVVAEDADGNETVSLDFDEEGGSLVFTDDGEESRVDVTIDEDNEQVVIEDSYGNDLVISENDAGGVVLDGTTANGDTGILEIDDDGFTGSTTEGGFTVGAQDAPEWLPTSFPLPADADIVASSDAADGSTLVVVAEGDVATVASAHQGALASQGYEVETGSDTAVISNYSVTHSDGTTVYTTVIDQGDGQIAVTMIFS